MSKFSLNKEFVHSRREFERNGFFLNEGFFRDEIFISSHMMLTIKSIERTRILPNRRLDLATQNEFARNLSNFVSQRTNDFDSNEEKE